MLEAACLGVAAGTAATLAQGTGLCQRVELDRLRPLVTVSAPQAAETEIG